MPEPSNDKRLKAALAGQFSNLITDPGEEIALFEKLCLATLSALPPNETWRAQAIRPRPDSALNPLCWGSRPEWHALPVNVQTQWKSWPTAFARLLARNPRFELADIMSEISETHYHSSWPAGWEDLIEDWVVGENLAPPPFDNRRNSDLAALRKRLQHLRGTVGGWVWWSDGLKRVVFGDTVGWAVERARLAAQKAEIARLGSQLETIITQWNAAAPAPKATKVDGDTARSQSGYHPMQQFRITRKS